MNKINYQLECDKIIENLGGRKKLLLHSCCAPCSSYVLTYLRQYFEITVLYYNPNISAKEEFTKRLSEQRRLIDTLNEEARVVLNNEVRTGSTVGDDIKLIDGRYEPGEFFAVAKGLENVKEGGERCFRCYELRLREAAAYAKKMGYDYFSTTLSISPLKNEQKLNEIGRKLSDEYGVDYLYSDFKKKNGYKISIELSGKYNLYRQNYCGCVYSVRE